MQSQSKWIRNQEGMPPTEQAICCQNILANHTMKIWGIHCNNHRRNLWLKVSQRLRGYFSHLPLPLFSEISLHLCCFMAVPVKDIRTFIVYMAPPSFAWHLATKAATILDSPCISVISSILFCSSSENPRKLKMQSWNGGTLNSFLNSSSAAQKSLSESKGRGC